jgi:cytochrome c oxidase cbb3-type subunit 3
MTSPARRHPPPGRALASKRGARLCALATTLLLVAGVCAAQTPTDAAADLAGTKVDAIAASPALAAAAARRAQPLYARHCAECHGAERQGDAARGVPNLADSFWLWGDGTADSELQALVQTLRVGIRSSHPQTRNIAEMPAFGPTGDPRSRLSPAQIDDLTEYVLRLSGQPHDKPAAQRGQALFAGAGNCFDCHSPDGSGNTDYGASDLTARLPSAWVYGRSRDVIRTSITQGRAGHCPDWGGTLDEADLKSLAVWLRGTAH